MLIPIEINEKTRSIKYFSTFGGAEGFVYTEKMKKDQSLIDFQEHARSMLIKAQERYNFDKPKVVKA